MFGYIYLTDVNLYIRVYTKILFYIFSTINSQVGFNNIFLTQNYQFYLTV